MVSSTKPSNLLKTVFSTSKHGHKNISAYVPDNKIITLSVKMMMMMMMVMMVMMVMMMTMMVKIMMMMMIIVSLD